MRSTLFKILLTSASFVGTTWTLAGHAQSLNLNEALPAVTLEKDEGGRVDGSAWSSTEMNGKVHLIFYVDPDEKKANEQLEVELKKADLPLEKYQPVAIINMAATWLPNAAISSSLNSKQKEYPRTIYVKDLHKKLVKTWGLADDAYQLVLIGKEGKVLWAKAGKLSSEETLNLIELIRKSL